MDCCSSICNSTDSFTLPCLHPNPSSYLVCVPLFQVILCLLAHLFSFLGPLKLNMVEYNGSLPTFRLNSHSWTKVYVICYLQLCMPRVVLPLLSDLVRLTLRKTPRLLV